MCRYCKIIPKYDEDGWDNYWDNEIDIAEESGWTRLRMGVLRDGKIYIAATGDDRAFYYPKYCPECGRRLIGGHMTNQEWIDLLSKEFAVSRTSARDMLHALMTIKRYDNFKRTFDPLPEPYREEEHEQ